MPRAHPPRWLPLLAALLGPVAAGAAPAAAQDAPPAAADPDAALAADPEAEPERLAWRGSSFTYRNVFTVNSLDRSAELTWNPYYAMEFGFRLRHWFGDIFHVGGRLEVSRELTTPDDTTYADEALLGDLILSAGASKFFTIPVLEIDLSADLLLTTPTSKLSRARTLLLGIGPGVSLSRTFEGGGTWVLNYHLRVTPNLFRYTTAGRATALIPTCGRGDGGCDVFLNTGERNVQVRVSHGGLLSWQPLDWLGASLAFDHIVDTLYPLAEDDPRVSWEPQDGTDLRHASAFEVEVTFTPLPALEVGLGYSTVSPQLAPDSSYRNPLYNRFSSLYLDLRLDVEGLVTQIGGETEGGV